MCKRCHNAILCYLVTMCCVLLLSRLLLGGEFVGIVAEKSVCVNINSRSHRSSSGSFDILWDRRRSCKLLPALVQRLRARLL